MNKDQVEGRKKEVTGKMKEVAGKIIGDKEMEVKGKVKNQLGKAQAGYGDVKSDVKKGCFLYFFLALAALAAAVIALYLHSRGK